MAKDEHQVWTRPVAVDLGRARSFVAAEAARSGPTAIQWIVGAGAAASLVLLAASRPFVALGALHLGFFAVFALSTLWRFALLAAAEPPGRTCRVPAHALPSYTVIAPLHREAEMVPALAAALHALDYPKERLQVIVALEADDDATFAAIRRHPIARSFEIAIAPPGGPKTKPRACNVALAQARGEHVVVYDAEDRPHPLQLQEAAARFAAGPYGLACQQAPLRIAGARGVLARHFGLEYAAQFEVMLPGLHRLGLPFPLGGTSNHFRTNVLRAVGGWDGWNVTEDADLGFRLAAEGYRTGLLRTPTWESAPRRLADWLPQRRRWIKGYMQTWGVQMRTPFKGGWRRFAALQATLGLSVLSALAHGPSLLALFAWAGWTALTRRGGVPLPDLVLLAGGWSAAAATMTVGARRAGLKAQPFDLACAPAYWSLQSLAAAMAIIQLCTRPHHWDKTAHQPPVSERIGGCALDGMQEARLRPAA